MRKNLRFCKYLLSDVRFTFILSLIVMALVHTSNYLLPYASKIVIDKFFYTKEYDHLLLYFIIFSAILVFSKLIFRFERMLSYTIDEKVNASFRKKSLITMFKKDYRDYSRHNYGEIETLYNNALPTISNSIYCITESVIAIPIAILVGLSLIVSITPFLVIFLFFEIIFMMFTARFGSVKRSKAYERTLTARKDYFNHLEKTFNAFENIRLNFSEDFAFKRLFHRCNSYKTKNLAYFKTDTIIMTIFDLIEILFQVATLFFFVIMAKNNSATIGDYFAYIGMKEVFVGVFNGVAQVSLRYKEMDVAINDIDSMINIKELIEPEETGEGLEELNNITSLSLKNIKFSYNDESPLYDLNYDFKKSNIYVIQGENGIGKSTLIRLLTGLLKPNSGTIVINHNKSINNFAERELFNKIKVLTQKPMLYDDSLLNNIFQGKLNISEKEVLSSFEAFFDINDIIKKYSNELYSNVFEDGIRLSGGQVKRIAMQSMFCSNAEVLIFDEPFGELDEKNKLKFYQLIKANCNEKIVIIISHECGWKWDCDEVFLRLALDEKNIIKFESSEDCKKSVMI